MPSAIDATVGGENSNSFMTEAEVDVYLDDRLNADAWNTLDPGSDNRLRAMIEATRVLTRLNYVGLRVNDTQALSWPRSFAIDPDYPEVFEFVEGVGGPTPLRAAQYFAENEIPQRVKNAEAELALEFLKAGTVDLEGRTDAVGRTDRVVIRKKIDTLETQWAAPGAASSSSVHSEEHATGLNRFPAVMREILPLLDVSSRRASGGLGTLEVIRV